MAMANGPVTSDGNFPAPGCAARCWENTKYISKCADKSTCLCHDAEYQNSIFKCIYSQCDTAHFGSALHHTMTRCVGLADNLLVVPPVSNHDSLRRREAQYLGGVKLEDSGSIVGYPTLSGLSLQSALPVASAVAFSSIPPLIYLTRDTVRASATASSVTTPVESARTTYNTAPEFITTSPLLFTGDGLKVLPSIFFLFSAAISGLYLAV